MKSKKAPITIAARAERRALREPFRIARCTTTHSLMMVVELRVDSFTGYGECEPHETDEGMLDEAVVEAMALAPLFAEGITRDDLAAALPRGPVRNAVDCALWDLDAKRAGTSAAQLAGWPPLHPCPTVYTLGIDSPDAMARKAAAKSDWTQFKIKLGGIEAARDLARVEAIRQARADADLIVDANGGWTMELLARMAPALASLGVRLIEQPLSPEADEALAGYNSPVPLCADEACLDRASLPRVIGRYSHINIKLDKTGGLTEALALADAAEAAGLGVMVGCMTGTSLAMAPALLVAQRAVFVDLDGPMLLAADRPHGMRYENGLVHPADPTLWG
jgi:L-alanine-DL-glutamate epimerase-like enolase superfamily enzyme